MAVREFEMFHGAVLTKLMRSEQPLTLRMIETRAADDWSTYRINDRVNVLVKHSLISRSLKREKAKAWQFVFSPDQIRQLGANDTWAALVCGSKLVGTEGMEVCLLDPEQIKTLIDVSSKDQQALTVKRIEGKSLRVFNSKVKEELVIARNRLEAWDIP